MTIEEYVISYLGAALEGVSVHGSVPHPMPPRFHALARIRFSATSPS